MKKADFLLAGAIVIFALIYGFAAGSRKIDGVPVLQITVDGKEFGIYDLSENREIRIGDTNICEIRDGLVRMTWADCPDHICVRSKAIGSDGGSIVCLPNKTILKITGRYEEGPDTVAG